MRSTLAAAEHGFARPERTGSRTFLDNVFSQIFLGNVCRTPLRYRLQIAVALDKNDAGRTAESLVTIVSHGVGHGPQGLCPAEIQDQFMHRPRISLPFRAGG